MLYGELYKATLFSPTLSLTTIAHEKPYLTAFQNIGRTSTLFPAESGKKRNSSILPTNPLLASTFNTFVNGTAQKHPASVSLCDSTLSNLQVKVSNIN